MCDFCRVCDALLAPELFLLVERHVFRHVVGVKVNTVMFGFLIL